MRIEIVAYQTHWPDTFVRHAQPIRAALGRLALRVDHVGSTSIPGADAKPIIDIQISVAAFEPFDPIRLPIQNLGYVWRADNPDRTKRYFREAPGTPRVHIHVRRSGSWSEQCTLLFRDYLRSHPDDVARYAALKYRLAAQYGENREGYTEAKSPFVWQVMARANAWSQITGWQPGPSDL
ncbi:MAG: GrpB family protein [Anaerolineae bacterium]|nr:GrpB family protein [Anaerolineae bacterium]